jgi:hypothetical protein
MKIKSYRVVRQGLRTLEDFITNINNLIEEGWQPFNSIAYGGEYQREQAMVIYEDDK